MKSVIRVFLPSLAVLSMLLFSGPAMAGMVATPKPRGDELPAREAAVEILQSRLAEAGMPLTIGESLKALPTEDLLALAATVESGTCAGSHHRRWFWWTIGLVVLLFWAVSDSFSHRHHHHDCE